MKLTEKLLSHLNRVFNKDAKPFDAMTITAADPVNWTVADAVLTLAVPSDPGMSLVIDLTNLNLQDVVDAANGGGFTATLMAIGDGDLSAMVLLDGTGSGSQAIQGFASLLWAMMNAIAYQLQGLGDEIPDMLQQLRMDLSQGEWVDFWLKVFLGTLRLSAETDEAAITRLISTVLTVKSNNKALELMVFAATGITVQVLDIPWLEEDNVTVDPDVIAQYSLSLLPGGEPAWGAANVLQCAFAVIFPSSATCAEYAKVMPIINANRAAGYYGIAYARPSPIKTNTIGDTTNTGGKLIGPEIPSLSPMVCP